MKTVDLIIDDKIKYPPDKETSAKTFRAGARCFSGGFFLRGGYQIGDFYEFLQIIVFGQHIQNIASFFGIFDVSLPFAGPLSDKLGRRISVLIGAASYVIFFIGIAFSPNIQVAYVAAVLGGVQTGPFPGDLPGDFRCHVGSGLPGENTDDLLRGSICDRLCSSRRCPSDGNSNRE